MHLLAAQPGEINEGDQAIDLGQSPGDVIFLTAADSEIALLSKVGKELPFSLRLANLMQLKHPMSVDMYLANTCSEAKMIIARLLGGRSYWSYLVDELQAFCQAHQIMLALLPGDNKPDEALFSLSTLSDRQIETLWHYLVEGGLINASAFLNFIAHLLDKDAPRASPPRRLLKAGYYWPGIAQPSLIDIEAAGIPNRPVALIIFYQALIEGANTAPIDALINALWNEDINALPIFVPSLKDGFAKTLINEVTDAVSPDLILNTTGFAVSSIDGEVNKNPFSKADCPVIQVVLASSTREAWAADQQGLCARDLAMHVVLPELDGRILSRAVSFKSTARFDHVTQANIITYQPKSERVAFVAKLARNWINLRKTSSDQRKIAIVLANYPNKDGRIGNGVGYDTPQSTIEIATALKAAGYNCDAVAQNGTQLVHALLEGTTNAKTQEKSPAELPLETYHAAFFALPDDVQKAVNARWGDAAQDPFVIDGAFQLAISLHGHLAIGIQPARGYHIDPKETYHAPDLVPPHGYFAFYIWLKQEFGAHAIIHNGKHGNQEWLPGKALALSQSCFPEAVLGPLPNFYPFIVNDPGEGTQAKRRSSAVIIDHLTPPLTRAETYGPLKNLEALIDEYYLASGLDPRRLSLLRRDILDLVRAENLDLDASIAAEDTPDEALQKLDAYLCELKEMQIRDGLHILGRSPQEDQERDLLLALVRAPRGCGEGRDQSLIRALAHDLGLCRSPPFDPLDCNFGDAWLGPTPKRLRLIKKDSPWRSHGDTVERLEAMARELVSSDNAAGVGPHSKAVLEELRMTIRPRLRRSGENEIKQLLRGLEGRSVPAGPSGAPTRGRIDVLPTGRNFFSIDNRTLPTPAAWTLGKKSADLLVTRYFQDHGTFPKSLGLSAWGTSNMRTGGDDIAQALALIGAEPKWDFASLRLTGFQITPLAKLGRPRIDVTLRISGFFRDAFPAQIALFDSAVQAVANLDESAADNPLTTDRTTPRIYGSKPGAYGAGLQAMIDENIWNAQRDLAQAYIEWGGYAYGATLKGEAHHENFKTRLAHMQGVLHNQDNREHDLLDSDDYYQFEGGMSAAVEVLSGQKPPVYHNDHSLPERPVIRSLEEEIGRVVRARVANPKWIAGVMRHGYKGACEIAATIDYMFAFAATTGAVKDHHFDIAFNAFIGDETVRQFILNHNAPAMKEIAQRMSEAIERGLWAPRLNSTFDSLQEMAQ